MRYYLVLVLLFHLSVLSFSQTVADSSSCNNDCLCTADVTPSGIMISHVHKKNEWMVSYKYMNMRMENILSGTNRMDHTSVFNEYLMSPASMQMDMHMIMGMYGLSDKITLMAMVNYNTAVMNMVMLPGAMHNMDGSVMGNGTMDHQMNTSGPGDIQLHCMYGLVNDNYHQLLIGTGISIPLGSTEMKGHEKGMYQHQRLPYSMQTGSGTLDILPVLNYLYEKGAFTFSSQVAPIIRTGLNATGYRLGNEVTFNNWLACQWSSSFSSSMRLEGYSGDRIHGKDATLYSIYEPSANPANYGGQKINGFIGTNFYITKGALKNNRLGVEYGIPFYQNLNGPQMGSSSSLYALWSITF